MLLRTPTAKCSWQLHVRASNGAAIQWILLSWYFLCPIWNSKLNHFNYHPSHRLCLQQWKPSFTLGLANSLGCWNKSWVTWAKQEFHPGYSSVSANTSDLRSVEVCREKPFFLYSPNFWYFKTRNQPQLLAVSLFLPEMILREEECWLRSYAPFFWVWLGPGNDKPQSYLWN